MKRLLLLVICFTLSSCTNTKNLKEISIVSQIFINYSQNYELSYVFFDPKGDSVNSLNDTDSVKIIEVRAETLEEGVKQIENQIGKLIFLDSCQALIVSKSAIGKKQQEIRDFYIDKNPVMEMFVCEDNFGEVLSENIGGYLTDLVNKSVNDGVIKKAKLISTDINLYNFNYTLIPYIKIENTETCELTVRHNAVCTKNNILCSLNEDESKVYYELKKSSRELNIKKGKLQINVEGDFEEDKAQTLIDKLFYGYKLDFMNVNCIFKNAKPDFYIKNNDNVRALIGQTEFYLSSNLTTSL